MGMKYEEYLRSPQWVARRTRFFAPGRMGKTDQCYVCRVVGHPEHFDLHHLSYERLGDEPDEHLTPVCRHCHRFIHRVTRMHPELTIFGATYVCRWMVLHRQSYDRAAQRWAEARFTACRRRGITEGVGDVESDGRVVPGRKIDGRIRRV